MNVKRTDYVDFDGIPTGMPVPPYNRVVALSGYDEVLVLLDPPEGMDTILTTLQLTLSVDDARRLASEIAASADEAQRSRSLYELSHEHPLIDPADLEGLPF